MIRLGAWFLLFAAGAAFAQTPPTPPVDLALDRYAAPASKVALPGGRMLNVDCRGRGGPTVLLLSGLGGWSIAWAPVHDRLAAQRRVCAFDPAGFGFSGPSAEPQDTAHMLADVEAALISAKIAGPYVVVGHSAGGYAALAFADRHRRDVAGMVLVDPSFPDQYAEYQRIAPGLTRMFIGMGDAQKTALRGCAQAMGKGPLKPGVADAESCLFLEPNYSAKLRGALAAADTPLRAQTRIAHLDGLIASSSAAVDPARNYGAMPLIVLTRGRMGPPPGAPVLPPEQAAEGTAADQAWVAAHAALARLSTRGEQRTVADAGHMIQDDQPDAVVTAVADVVKATQR